MLAFAKLWCWGSEPTGGPNANGFESQWNIGLIIRQTAFNNSEISYSVNWAMYGTAAVVSP